MTYTAGRVAGLCLGVAAAAAGTMKGRAMAKCKLTV